MNVAGLNFTPKGYKTFSYNNKELKIEITEYPEDVMDMHTRHICGDLFSGYEFLRMVEQGSIIDYDGNIGVVVIDDYYLTNLGLNFKGIHKGYFQVDEDTWKEICYKHKIAVEWCNK